jgi:hypothetical protein
MTALYVAGAIAVAYVGVRIVATVVDIVGRWRRNDWST